MKRDNKPEVMSTGIAFDIGTTTLAAASVDTASGAVTDTLSAANPQAAWGADVLARIKAASEGPEGTLEKLSESIKAACNGLLLSLARGRKIREITVAGNSVMEHIFLKVSPASMARAPYRPVFREARVLKAEEAGLEAPGAGLYLFPIIGAFVGGDAVAAALYLGLREKTKNTLTIDLGTNSEIMLKAGEKLYVTSAAAGPAFEAGGLECGMTAGPGAIRGVAISGESLTLDVISAKTPKGICGSGLIEAAAALINAGIIEPSGRIKGAEEIHTNLANFIKEEAGGNRFILYRGASAEISLTQADIRGLQVAKSAIRAGISFLLKKAGLKPRDLDRVYIAGAFGASLEPNGLAAIGLIDPKWAGNIEFVGDAALKGAAMAFSKEKKSEASFIAANSTYLPLSGSRFFEKEFIREMDFAPLPL
ncbi:MAG: ASKHA domain-containing protein [Thermodesulfobacteriota bacterium]